MNKLMFAIVLSVLLVGCTENKEPAATSPSAGKTAATGGKAADKSPGGDVTAGKAVAERECKACHGLDGKGVAPGIPHLAAQRERYLLLALTEYKDGKRTHAALRELAGRLNPTDLRNVVAYYSSQPPPSPASGKDSIQATLAEKGKALGVACEKCHGEDGNSRTPGTPSLAGQQPHYLVTAIQEYHRGDRGTAAMKTMLRDANRLELESLALYFASQTPVQRAAPTRGDPAAGEPLTAMCGGCHGPHGVSSDAATPSLAGQDPQYLVKAIKAYRTTRQHWGMQRYVTGLSDKDIENIAAFYAVQQSRGPPTGCRVPLRNWPKNAIAATTPRTIPAMVAPICGRRTRTIWSWRCGRIATTSAKAPPCTR